MGIKKKKLKTKIKTKIKNKIKLKLKKKLSWSEYFLLFRNPILWPTAQEFVVLVITALIIVYCSAPVIVCYYLFGDPRVVDFVIVIMDEESTLIAISHENYQFEEFVVGKEEGHRSITNIPTPKSATTPDFKNYFITKLMKKVKFYEILFRYRAFDTPVTCKTITNISFSTNWTVIETFKYNAYTNSIKIEIVLISKDGPQTLNTKLSIAKMLLQNRNTGISDNQIAQKVLFAHLKNESNEIDDIT